MCRVARHDCSTDLMSSGWPVCADLAKVTQIVGLELCATTLSCGAFRERYRPPAVRTFFVRFQLSIRMRGGQDNLNRVILNVHKNNSKLRVSSNI